jgi:hypothetical protein
MSIKFSKKWNWTEAVGWSILKSERCWSANQHAIMHYGFMAVSWWEFCVPALQTWGIAVITAEKCRLRATESKTLASPVDVPTQRSLEQSVLARDWEALADQIDRDNAQATEARLAALFASLFRRPLVA